VNFIPLAAATAVDRYGGKALHLAEALRAGLPVPPGFAIAWPDVDACARGEGDLAALASALAGVKRVAVRSSAVDEDGAAASFAGQHATVLGVSPQGGLLAALQAVHASARTPSALAYRRKLGLATEPRMAVVVQALVEAEVAGVLFTRDPVSGADERVIEASWGLGEAVVAGLVTPDRFRVARGARVLAREAGEKDLAVRWRDDGEGTEEVSVTGPRVHGLCLDDGQLAALDALAARCEAVFGGAQDLEFAFARGALHLLQRRAITRG